MIDSGTTFTYLLHLFYTKVYEEIEDYCKLHCKHSRIPVPYEPCKCYKFDENKLKKDERHSEL